MSRIMPRIYMKATRKDGFRREGLFTRVDIEVSTSGSVWVKTERCPEIKFADEFVCEEIETKLLTVEEATAWQQAFKGK